MPARETFGVSTVGMMTYALVVCSSWSCSGVGGQGPRDVQLESSVVCILNECVSTPDSHAQGATRGFVALRSLCWS